MDQKHAVRLVVAAEFNMRPSLRFKLYGTYETPRHRIGQRVECEARGTVQIVGTSDGRIPWPIGRKGRSVALVMYGDLYRAVRTESPTAVGHWWGVSFRVVSRWRSALGIAGKRTEGSKRLRAECGKDLALLKAGKPRAPETIAKMREAATGKRQSEETRAKRSATHKAIGNRPPWLNPPWTQEEDAMVRTLAALEAARRTRRTLQAVYQRRYALGLPDGRKRNGE